jgi:hypothetical protein
MSKLTSRTLSVLIIAAFLLTAFGGVILAQVPTVSPLPINDTADCVPFNESPLSLRDINGVTNDKFLNTRDLDGDGYINEAEFVARSDPTYSKSTPLDHDGDGFGQGQDPCDYNERVPQALIVEILSVKDAATGLVDADFKRGESFRVEVLVKTPAGVPVDTADVKLVVTQSPPGALEDGPVSRHPMVDAPGTGKYTVTVPIAMGDFADPEKPWLLDVEAIQAGGGPASKPDADPKEITVRPLTNVAVNIQTLSCKLNAALDVIGACEAEDVFFNGQAITVNATPDYARFYQSGLANPTRQARLSFQYELYFAGEKIATLPMKPQADAEDPTSMKMKEFGSGNTLKWSKTIDPAQEFLIPPELDLFGFLGQSKFLMTVKIKDDAVKANTGVGTANRDVFFAEEVQVIVESDGQVSQRGDVLHLKAQFLFEKEPVSAGPTIAAAIYDPDDADNPTLVANVVMTEVVGQPGHYAADYTIGIGDQMTQDPFVLDDEDPTAPGPNYAWTVVATAGLPGNQVSGDGEVLVKPRELSGAISFPNGNQYTVEQGAPGITILTLDAIPIVYTPAAPYHDDGLGAGPGQAFYSISDSRGAPVVMETPMTWNPATSKFTALANVPGIQAQLQAGEWTVKVRHQDDADVPNEGGDSEKIKINSAGVTVTRDVAEAKITEVYGWNAPTIGSGLTADPAKDKDPVFDSNPLTADDGISTKRYLVVKGTSKAGLVKVCPPDNQPECVSVPQAVGGVFVQLNDRMFHGTIDYYAAAAKIGADFDNWQIIFDTADPLFPALAADMSGVKIDAFAYTGAVVASTPGHVDSGTVTQGGQPVAVNEPVLTAPPITYVAADPAGLYSALASRTFTFDYHGPSTIVDMGLRYPGVDVFGGGPKIVDKNSLTVLAKYSDPNGVEVFSARLMFAEVSFRKCTPLMVGATSGGALSDVDDAEWCHDKSHLASGNPTATPTWLAMTKVSGSTELFSATVAGGADGFRESDCDGDSSNGFLYCRWWSRAELTNIDGYVTRSTPGLANIPGEPRSNLPSTTTLPVTGGKAPGFSVVQWIVGDPTISITSIGGLSDIRPDYRQVGPARPWTPATGTFPFLHVGSDTTTKQAAGFVEGDTIAISGVFDDLEVPGFALSGTITLAMDDSQGAGGVTFTGPITVDQALHTWSATLAFNAANPATGINAVEGMDYVGQRVGTIRVNGNVQITATITTTGSYTTSDSRRVIVDRDATPEVKLLRIDWADREGQTGTDVSALPRFSGVGTLVFEGFDLDDARTGSDVRKLDAIEISLDALKPDVQHFAGGSKDEFGLPSGRQEILFPFQVQVPRCLVAGVSQSCNNNFERQWDGIEYFFPLRVGNDPLLIEVDESGVPSPNENDRVFGFDTAPYDGGGYVRTFGPKGNVAVTEANWNTATYHAIEMNLEEDPEGGGPYIGITSSSGNVHLAIAVDRGVTDGSWALPGDTSGTPDQWNVVKCTIENVNTLDGFGDTVDDFAGGDTFPSNTDCNFLEDYFVGVINHFTPLTIYSNANSLGLGQTDYYPNAGPGRGDDYDTGDDFLGPDQEGKFTIPRAFIWNDITGSKDPAFPAPRFSYPIVSMASYADLTLPSLSDRDGTDMFLADKRYAVTARGIDGVDITGAVNDEGPLFVYQFVIENDLDDDGYSNALENKTRNQIHDGSHKQFAEGGYRGSLANPDTDLPLMAGTKTFQWRPNRLAQPVPQTITALQSTPCDWDGDGIENDVQCLGLVDLEAAFNMNPFVWDTPFDDPNNNNIPNFMDFTQRYRFDCTDSDHDNWCDSEETFAGSDPNDPLSQPGDDNGNSIPDDLEFVPVPDVVEAIREVLDCGATEQTPECVQRNIEESTQTVQSTVRGVLCAPTDPETKPLEQCAQEFAMQKAGCDEEDASLADCAIGKSQDAEQAVRTLLCPAGSPATKPIQECADSFLASKAGCNAGETTTQCAERKAGGGVEALRSAICPSGAPATMPIEQCADYFIAKSASCNTGEAAMACAVRKAGEGGGAATQAVRNALCPGEAATTPLDRCADIFVAGKASCNAGETSRACAERKAAEAVATFSGRVCIRGVVAPGPDPTCGNHNVKVTLAIPGANYLFVDITGSGATSKAVVGIHDGTSEKPVATGDVGQTLGVLLGLVGTLQGIAGSALDPDGDGYATDRELASFTNPFHWNSKPTNRGGGWPQDWDADGYPNDRELAAAGGPSDPIRSCSNPNNKAGGISPASWPNMGKNGAC